MSQAASLKRLREILIELFRSPMPSSGSRRRRFGS